MTVTATTKPTATIELDQEVTFNDGRGNTLTGVVVRVWNKPNAPYATIRTSFEDRPRTFVRLIRDVGPASSA
jgi:hypothetical protein